MREKEKQSYLKLYGIQHAKLQRLELQMRDIPENAEKYLRQAQECRELRDKIERDIESVDGSILSEILCQKFMCGKTLEEIALRLNYSKRHIERLFISALEALVIS